MYKSSCLSMILQWIYNQSITTRSSTNWFFLQMLIWLSISLFCCQESRSACFHSFACFKLIIADHYQDNTYFDISFFFHIFFWHISFCIFSFCIFSFVYSHASLFTLCLILFSMIFYCSCHLYISFTLRISLMFFNIAFWTVFCSQCLCVSALTAWKKFQMISQSARAHFIIIIIILKNSLALIHISRSVTALIIQQIIVFEVEASIMNIINLNLINMKIYQTILTAIIHQQHQVCLAQHSILT